ncbi:MAG: hypothetical protein QM811_18875 [Pirellulales bacterium]
MKIEAHRAILATLPSMEDFSTRNTTRSSTGSPFIRLRLTGIDERRISPIAQRAIAAVRNRRLDVP